jgi:hypothetical protein
MPNIFDAISKRENEIDKPIQNPERAARWYMDLIKQLGLSTISSHKIFKSEIGEFVNNIIVGEMYIFVYDPKTKDTLPYYDTVPLVIPFNKVPGGFYAINFHYLPPMLRMRLLTQLMKLSDDKVMTKTTKLRLRWSLLNNAARFPGIQACVKRYLYTQVDSRFMRLHPKDWKKSVMLPLDNFVKGTKQQVYNDTRSKMQ